MSVLSGEPLLHVPWNVTDAFAVSHQIDEQADALIGYFVDQARRSGASWSQIGGAARPTASRLASYRG